MAEKMITLGKKNTEASKRQALAYLFVRISCCLPESGILTCTTQRPQEMLPKLFGPLRERYANRPGGYTRVLRIEPIKEDQAASAILELVDGPKDMRFALTAKTIATVRQNGHKINDMTAANIAKVTNFRKDADQELEEMVQKFERMAAEGEEENVEVKKRRVYPKNSTSR